MDYSVRMTERAFTDINSIMDWLQQHTQVKTDTWFVELIEAIFSLEEFPRIGCIAPESEDIGGEIRQLFHGKRRHTFWRSGSRLDLSVGSGTHCRLE